MNEQVMRIVRHPATIPALIGVGSFAVGVGCGVLFQRSRKPEEQDLYFAEVETVETVDPDEDVEYDTDVVFETPRLVLDAAEYEVIAQRQESDPEQEDETDPTEAEADAETERQNVFSGGEDDWDYEIEVVKRTDGEPFVIHRDEYMAQEHDYPQSTFTWYAGDDIMADEQDKPVYNYPAVMGDLDFGHGSGDPNVVYIRNPDLQREYEVLLHSGHYKVEVEGFQFEQDAEQSDLKHSAHRRFRED